MSSHNSILIKGAGKAIQFEQKAGETLIYPGHLVEASSDTTFLRCNANGVAAEPLIAIENNINGKTKDDVYANGETVYARSLVSGMEVQVRLAPSAAAVVYGDLLTPDGDGGVKKAVAFSQLGSGTYAVTPASFPMFRAIEAVDNSANASTSVFIKARKI